MIKKLFQAIVCLFSLTAFAQTPPSPTSGEIYLALKKLNVLGSVLYIAAHPDDENNYLLPYLSKEKLYRTAYLSLTRGDGGQNLIGSEQGEELGQIRTQELLAARRIDGCEQYFTRAYEFGFSKNATEALRIWDKEKILSDVVWVIRQFQPDIIITRFPTDGRAGHGHHSASAILANEAFQAAADPNRFPEQFSFGVKPWQAKRILWNTFNFGSTNTTNENQFNMEIGLFNPLLGKSYGEIGADARSMHKCQGEGRPERHGSIKEYFETTGGDSPQKNLMEGVEISWNRVTKENNISQKINSLVENFRFDNPSQSVPELIELYKNVESLPDGVWRTQKLGEIQNLIEQCSGLFVEASTSKQKWVQGEKNNITISITKRADLPVEIKRLSIGNTDTTCNIALIVNSNFEWKNILTVPTSMPISQPYWLENPRAEGSFVVNDQRLIGKPQNDPAFIADIQAVICGKTFIIKRPLLYKTVDPVRGELYHPVSILPTIELNYTMQNFIALNGKAASAQIHFNSNISDSSRYCLVQEYDSNWKYKESIINFPIFDHKENDWIGHFKPIQPNKSYTGKVTLTTKDGKYCNCTKTIAYDHIPIIDYFPKAQANLVALKIISGGKKIGYLSGAGDKVPTALEQMGYEVTQLDEKDITEQSLSKYDAIVTGVRAYNLHYYLTERYNVLMNYVKKGGNLIVQYNKGNLSGNLPIKVAYPFSAMPLSRVTEENAKVTFLLPQSPVFTFPNKITDSDFEGWVHERSTYQAEQIDSHYDTPIQMNDANEKPTKGSLLVAKFGKGNFVYTGLVFFRQLPAGVAGAYRLFANLISLPKNK